MTRNSLALVTYMLIAGFLVAPSVGSAAGPTGAQKCAFEKAKALGDYYACVLKAEGKAFKDNTMPDLTSSDNNIHSAFAKIEAHFGSLTSGGCTFLDVDQQPYLISKTRRDSTQMACLVTQEAGIDRGGTVTFVDFTSPNGTTLSVRNTTNVPVQHAKCFYADATCSATSEFALDVPAQGESTWDPENPPAGIPPLPSSPFTGYVVCVSVDDTGIPFFSNALIASVSDANRCPVDGPILRGFDTSDDSIAIFNLQLCLGSPVSTDCPNGADLDPCPYDFITGTPFKPLFEGCWSTLSSFTFHCQQ